MESIGAAGPPPRLGPRSVLRRWTPRPRRSRCSGCPPCRCGGKRCPAAAHRSGRRRRVRHPRSHTSRSRRQAPPDRAGTLGRDTAKPAARPPAEPHPGSDWAAPHRFAASDWAALRQAVRLDRATPRPLSTSQPRHRATTPQLHRACSHAGSWHRQRSRSNEHKQSEDVAFPACRSRVRDRHRPMNESRWLTVPGTRSPASSAGQLRPARCPKQH